MTHPYAQRLGRVPTDAAILRAAPPLWALQRGAVNPLRAWRYWTPGRVLDQGNTPHCVGYGWRQFLQTSPIRTVIGPSGDDIYYAAKVIDHEPHRENGSSVHSGAEAVGKTFGRLVPNSTHWAQTLEDVHDFLLTTGPVVFGTNWYTSMFTPKNGWLSISGQIEGGHCYLCLGMNRLTKRYKFINSWGDGWSHHGIFWMHEEDVGRLLAERGEAASAIERRAA
jgi:hypothetical protein